MDDVFLRARARQSQWLRTAFLLAALAITSTAVEIRSAEARPRDPIAPSEIESRVAELHLPPSMQTRPSEALIETYEGCAQYSAELHFLDSVSGTRRTQTISVWLPEPLGGPKPAVIVVPTIEGRTVIEDRTAYWACTSGLIGVIADVNDTTLPQTLPDWGYEDRHMRHSVTALQAVTEWASGDRRIQPGRIGAVGVSLGGITTALWLGVDPRVRAGMIVAGGGNLPEILALSTQKRIVALRESRMRAAGLLTAAEYEEALQKTVRFDPYYLGARTKATLKMVSGTGDVSVPFADQDSLWDILGRPERLLIPGPGHIETIVEWAYLHMGESIDWLKSRLEN
jgi:dienelactone hydrolase